VTQDGVHDGAEDTGEGRQAAAALAMLSAAGVPGADPDEWYALSELSEDAPVVAAGEPVVVSPSRV
jgi:hypothetical protein